MVSFTEVQGPDSRRRLARGSKDRLYQPRDVARLRRLRTDLGVRLRYDRRASIQLSWIVSPRALRRPAKQPLASPLQADELVTTGTLTVARPIRDETWSTVFEGIRLPGLSVAFDAWGDPPSLLLSARRRGNARRSARARASLGDRVVAGRRASPDARTRSHFGISRNAVSCLKSREVHEPSIFRIWSASAPCISG